MKKIIIYVKGFLIVNILWFMAAWAVEKPQAPNPIRVYHSFRFFIIEHLYIDIIVSLYRIFAGITISLVLGSTIGYLMASRKSLNTILDPIVVFLFPVPKAVLLPVIIAVFGSGEVSKIIIITLLIVFHIIISVRDTVLSIDRECIDYVLSLGASRKQVYKNVIYPQLIPGIINNVRIKIRTAISILFFCEVFGTPMGMGHYVLDAWLRNDYISMYKGIIIVCIMGIVLYSLVDLADRKLVKWKK